MKISLDDNEERAEEIYPEISLKIFSVEDNVELGNRTAAAAASFERKLSDTHILTIRFERVSKIYYAMMDDDDIDDDIDDDSLMAFKDGKV